MDAIGAAIGAACEEALKPMQAELREQKASQHAAIDLFRDRLGELRRLVEGQGRRMKALEDENAILRNARQPSVASADELHSLSEDFEDLRQTLNGSLKSLRDGLGALRNDHETFRTRLGLLAEEQEQSLLNAGHGRQSIEGFTQRQSQSAHQINTLMIDRATFGQALNNQANELARVQQAVAQLSNLAGRRDYSPMIGALRNAVGELRTASQGHTRSITMLTSAQGARSPVNSPSLAQSTQLERRVRELDRQHLDHTSRLASLENWRAAGLRNQEEQLAHLSRHDEALALIEGRTSRIDTTLETTARQVSEMQEELLTVTRTLLGVIKAMRTQEQFSASEAAGPQAQSPTLVSQLQAQVEATLSTHHKDMVPPSREVIMLDDVAAVTHDVAQGDSTGSAGSTAVDQDEGTTLVENVPALTEDQREERNGEDFGMITQVETPALQPGEEEIATSAETKTKYLDLPARDGYCHGCGRTQSSRWLGGPNGTRTLCNTCGPKWSKAKRGLSGDARREATRAFTAAARQTSTSSTSTFASRDGKETVLQKVGVRGLKRKPALSPLQEHFENNGQEGSAFSPHATQSGASSAPEIPIIRLTRTGYTLATAPNSDSGSPPPPYPNFDGNFATTQQNAPIEQGASTKRKRMNADEKARMFANESVAESGSESGQKRRRSTANKTVRFEPENDLSDVDGEEAHDCDESAATSVKIVGGQADQESLALTDSNNSIASSNDVAPSGRGTTSTTKQPKPQGRGPKKTSSNAKSNAADDVRSSARYRALNMLKPQKPGQTAVVDEEPLDDSSEDNIVVARPSRPPSAQHLEPPLAAVAADTMNSHMGLLELERAPRDILGSEDELALPTRPLRNKGHPSPSYKAASVRALAPGDETYRSLLSQFNVGRDARVEDEVVMASIEQPESETTVRSKRAPKPGKLGDVVDVRSLTAEQLGE